MKKILLSLVALLCATMSFAQNQIATLSHGDEIKMYSGAYAFREAMKAAENGDVITLSSGSFEAADITKAVSIRGAGFLVDEPTYINGNLIINIPTTVTKRLTMEGIRVPKQLWIIGSLKNAMFINDWIQKLYITGGGNASNIMFVASEVKEVDAYGANTAGSLVFANCYVENYNREGRIDDNIISTFVNCVIWPYYYLSGSTWVPSFDTYCNSTFTNCILGGLENQEYEGRGLPSSSSATNCLSLVYKYTFSNTNSKSSNWTTSNPIFKTDRWHELTDEANKTYLGTDGTPVGMYGGMMPYSGKTSYPRITKMNVANKTTADGKLSVEIEVSAGNQ